MFEVFWKKCLTIRSNTENGNGISISFWTAIILKTCFKKTMTDIFEFLAFAAPRRHRYATIGRREDVDQDPEDHQEPRQRPDRFHQAAHDEPELLPWRRENGRPVGKAEAVQCLYNPGREINWTQKTRGLLRVVDVFVICCFSFRLC